MVFFYLMGLKSDRYHRSKGRKPEEMKAVVIKIVLRVQARYYTYICIVARYYTYIYIVARYYTNIIIVAGYILVL